MTKLIFCQNPKQPVQSVRVRVIKAPLVDSVILKQIMEQKPRASVL